MFDDYPELADIKDEALQLAKYDQWEPLYDEVQLKNNIVPVFAASYIEDMYVDYDLARETARKVKGIRTFETNACKFGRPSLSPFFVACGCRYSLLLLCYG